MTDQQQQNATSWGWLIVLALPLIAIGPTFHSGIMAAADAPLHVHRIFAMGTLLQEGVLYPRWVPWFHLGYGYPVFNYYPPGVFYVGALFMLLGFSAITAFHLTAALAWIWGGLGMYKLARQFTSDSGAVLAAALWAYAPSRLFEVWTQGSLPQIASAAFIPWIFYTVYLTAKQPSKRHSVGLALALASLILTHQPMTFITALYVAPLTVILVAWFGQRAGNVYRRALSTYGGILLGAGLTAIFLIPVFLELPLVEAIGATDDVETYLQTNFLVGTEAISWPQPPDLTDIRTFYPRTLGLHGLILLTLGLIAIAQKRHLGYVALLAIAIGFTLFMTNERSLWLWLHIPFFEQLRFPERFLRAGAVFIALGGGMSVLAVKSRYQNWLSGILTLSVVALMIPFIYPTQPFVTYPDLSALDEIEFESSSYTWGTTSYNEFNPRWGDKAPYDFPPSHEIYETTPSRIFPLIYFPYEQVSADTFRITIDEPQQLLIRQFYFPGWRGTVNGETVELYPVGEYGLIGMDVPDGELTITLQYKGTATQRIATTITLASIALALWLFIGGKSTHTTSEARTSPISLRHASMISGTIMLLALVNVRWIMPHTDWFRLQSDPNQPTYMRTSQPVTFEGGMTLLGYTLDRAEIGPHDKAQVTLFWHPSQDIQDANYRAVVQIVNQSITETWAVSQPIFIGGEPPPPNGYTSERFVSDLHTLRLFDHAKPYTGQIMVQLFDSNKDEPVQRADGASDRVVLNETLAIDLPNPTLTTDLANINVGESLTIACYQATPNEDTLTIDVYWRVTGDVARDYTTFIHGLNTQGDIIAQADQPPIADYPTSEWRNGQLLTSRYTLPLSDELETVRLGLYDVNGNRLTMTFTDTTTDALVITPHEMSSSVCITES